MDKNKLIKKLSLVKLGLSNKEVIEQSTCFVFKDKKVFAYNDEIAISIPIDIGIVGAIQAKELYSLLSKVKDKEIEFTQKYDSEINIKGKKFKSGIKLETEIKLPLDAVLKVKGRWSKLPDNFIEAVDFCKFSASNDESLPILTCVYIHNNIVQSSDKYRATEYMLSEDCFKKSVLIPANSIEKLSKCDINEYIIKSGWIHFRNTKTKLQFSCRTLNSEEPYPTEIINTILKKTKTSKTITFPEEIKDILNTAEIFTTSDFNQSAFVNINIKKGRMFIKGEGVVGWYKEPIKIKYKDKEEINFMINPKFLTQILNHVNEVHVDVKNHKILFNNDNFIHTVSMHKE